MTALALTGTKEKIRNLLGDGHGPELVSSAVGVSVSYISQLLSDSNFAKEVADLRVMKLAKHAQRDATYDDMEDMLAKKMHDLIPYMMEPMKIMRVLKDMNALKRRSVSANENIANQQTVVQLSMPNVIVNKFQVNINNQVITAGDQSLVTVQSGALAALAQKLRAQNVPTLPSPDSSNA